MTNATRMTNDERPQPLRAGYAAFGRWRWALLGIVMAARLAPMAPGAAALAEVSATQAAEGAYRTFELAGQEDVLIVPNGWAGGAEPPDVLVHFHGQAATVAREFLAAGLDGVLIVVNRSGLSAAYAGPFEDGTLLDELLSKALARLQAEGLAPPTGRWGRLALSSFSAGYGAVRAVLHHPRIFDRIDALVLADSLYAGYQESPGGRQVNPANMADFRRFAEEAAAGRRTFILSHCYLVPGSYASTIETADDLIAHVGAERRTVRDPAAAPFEVVSRAGKGRFEVHGCTGTDGEAHMQHLRHLRHWLLRLKTMPAVDTQPADRQHTRGTTTMPVVVTERARRLHQDCLVFDGHCDLPWNLYKAKAKGTGDVDVSRPVPEFQVDIPRMKEGGLGAIFLAAYAPPSTMQTGGAARIALEQIDIIHGLARRYPETFALARTAEEVRAARAGGRIALLIGVEGGHAIENSLGVLRMFHALGVRYMTLTHEESTDWCDAAMGEPRHGGLSPFGEQVVAEMNRLGMMPDISHVSPAAMRAVLRISTAPVIASHSSAYAVAAHPRNLPDDVLAGLKASGGAALANFFSGYIEPQAAAITLQASAVMRDLKSRYPDEEQFREVRRAWQAANPLPRGTVHTLVDHLDHMVRVAGIEHVGIGSDFDGVNVLPEQLDDVSCYPYLTQALLDRGYSEADIRAILGGTLLRVLARTEAAARADRHTE